MTVEGRESVPRASVLPIDVLLRLKRRRKNQMAEVRWEKAMGSIPRSDERYAVKGVFVFQ